MQGGLLGEERGDVRVRADAQQQDIERRHIVVVARSGGLAKLDRVALGRRLRIVAVRPVGCRHRVHPPGVDRHVVEQSGSRAGLVALRVTGWQEPFVAPPDVQPGPVDRVAARRLRQGGKRGRAQATTGEHD